MAKITLDNITSSFASTSLFQTNFTAIEDELNDKVLYRDNPMGEPNQMLNDFDMNSNDILNAGDIATATITVGGVDLTAQVAAAATSAANAATSEANAATSETNAAASAANAAASEVSTQAIADAIEGNAVWTDTEFTSSAGIDTFAVTYIPGRVIVLLNGVDLADADFTATNGTSVVLTTPLANNSDVLTVRTYTGFGIADALAITNNLSDVASVNTSRNNLGIFSGNKNLVINGDFSVWQRGTFSTAAGYTSDDRWQNNHVGSTKNNIQTAFTAGQTDVPNNPKFFCRTSITSVAGAGNYVSKTHKVEDVNTASGQQVTLSFWAKADSAKNIATEFIQSFGTGGSPSAAVLGIVPTTHALTTSWQKFTVTATIPSISGKTLGTDDNHYLGFNFWFEAGSDFDSRTNTLGQQSGDFDISNVQLEFGDTATDFEFVSPADQLARCRRYYRNLVSITGGGSHPVNIGTVACWDTSNSYVPVDTGDMRAAPTLNISNVTHFDVYESGTAHTCTDVSIPLAGNPVTELLFESTSNFVAGNAAWVRANTTSAVLGLDSEL